DQAAEHGYEWTETDPQGNDQAGKRPNHEHFAMGKMQEPQDAEDQRITDGDKSVGASQHEPVGELLQKHARYSGWARLPDDRIERLLSLLILRDALRAGLRDAAGRDPPASGHAPAWSLGDGEATALYFQHHRRAHGVALLDAGCTHQRR